MKLKKTDSVDIHFYNSNHYFVESDNGNYSAIKNKYGKWELQKYIGSLDEYTQDNDLKKPTKSGLRMIQDFFGNNICINEIPLESVE